MKYKMLTALLVLTFMLPGNVVLGQQTQSRDAAIAQLELAIQKLEAVDRDPATPAQVRMLNHGFLEENRRRLRVLIEQSIVDLRQYLASLKGVLSPEQVQTAEESIAQLQKKLDRSSNIRPSDSAATSGLPTSSPVDSSTAAKTSSGPSAPTNLASDEGNTTSAANAATRPSSVPTANSLVAQSPVLPAQNPAFKAFPAPQDCANYKASPKTFSKYEQYVCTLVEQTTSRKNSGNSPLIELDQEQGFDLVVILMAQKLRSTFLTDAEEARVDKQVGASGSNAGSTTLVTKGGTPAILGLAVENGALEREISGTTITFRGNPVGVVDALKNKGFISGYEDDSPATRFLRKTSFAFSFDTSLGTEPGVFTGKKQQLSSVSSRLEFINERDPRRSEYKTDWENFAATKAAAFLNALVNFKSILTEVEPGTGTGPVPAVIRYKDQALQDWYKATQAEITNAAPGNVEIVVKAQLAKLPIDELSPETVTALTNVARQFGVYLEGRQRILDRVAKGTIATFEYTNKRGVNAPDTSNFLGIYETAFGGQADFTFNGSMTIFNKLAAGPTAKRVRDFQFAAQLDFPFGDVNGPGQFVLSASGKYQRLTADASTLAGTTVPNTRGDIAVGQVKLSIPIKGLGIKFPISVTFANRTELVKEKEVRGNFGFTFDLDTIFSKFKPF